MLKLLYDRQNDDTCYNGDGYDLIGASLARKGNGCIFYKCCGFSRVGIMYNRFAIGREKSLVGVYVYES